MIMAEHYSFFDAVQDSNGNYDREYNAQQFTDYFETLVTTGIMRGVKNDLAVSVNGANMVSSVQPGIAFVEGRFYHNDSILDLTHDTEIVGLSRIDRVVIRLDLNNESRYVRAFIKKGLSSAEPAAPELTRNANVFEISLTQVRIVGGQTYLDLNSLTDERGTPVICPWASSKVLPDYDNNALASHIENPTIHVPYAVTTGTPNVYGILVNGVTAYVEGMAVSVKINVQNTGSSTININGLGAKSIIKGNGNAVSSGNLKANSIYTLRYNGTAFILQGEGGEGTATQAQVLTGSTFTNDTGTFAGTMVNQGAKTYTPGRSNIAIPTGYHNGSGYVLGDSDLLPSNIKNGVNIFGVTGTATTLVAHTSVSRSISGSPTSQTFDITLYASFPIKQYAIAINGIYFGSYYVSSVGALVDGKNSGSLTYGSMSYGSSSYLSVSNTSTISGNTLYGSIRITANSTGLNSQSVYVEAVAWGS